MGKEHYIVHYGEQYSLTSWNSVRYLPGQQK